MRGALLQFEKGFANSREKSRCPYDDCLTERDGNTYATTQDSHHDVKIRKVAVAQQEEDSRHSSCSSRKKEEEDEEENANK